MNKSPSKAVITEIPLGISISDLSETLSSLTNDCLLDKEGILRAQHILDSKYVAICWMQIAAIRALNANPMTCFGQTLYFSVLTEESLISISLDCKNDEYINGFVNDAKIYFNKNTKKITKVVVASLKSVLTELEDLYLVIEEFENGTLASDF